MSKDIKGFTVRLDVQLVAVLEHTRNNILAGCRYGARIAMQNNDQAMLERWKEELDMLRDLPYEELHSIMIEEQYRKLHL